MNWTNSFMYVHFVFTTWRLWENKTLNLSAVILAPTGTVYMLLGDKGRHPKQQKQFGCHISLSDVGFL